MKTICVLSYERTGSTWLCTALNTSQTWCVFEIFSRNPALYYWNMLALLRIKDNIPLSVIETFKKIYYPNNLFADAKSFAKIKQNMLAKEPFSIDLLKDFQSEAYGQHRNFCFKVFPEHLDNHIKIQDIIERSDHIIINYRSNVLETFLSWKIAIKTGAWSSKDIVDPSIQNPRIIWNKEEYDVFYRRIVENINLWLKISSNKNRTILRYEDIHSHQNHEDKIEFLQKKFRETNLDDLELNYNNDFKKQIDYSSFNNLIENYSNFQNDLNPDLNIYYLHDGI
jgi:LPS sulfotransferase NodH